MKKSFYLLLICSLVFSYRVTGTIPGPNNHSGRDSIMIISLGGSMTFSTVNLGIEPVGELKKGLNARANIRFRRRLGISAEYTDLLNHEALPAWANIEARNFDVNLDYAYLYVAESLTRFYGLIGASYQQWKGVYLGTPAFDRDVFDFKEGEIQRFSWPAVNLGFGFERNFRYWGPFGEFKFRFGKDFPDEPYGIVDVCLNVGIKVNLMLPGAGSKNTPHSRNHQRKMKIKPKIYHWF